MRTESGDRRLSYIVLCAALVLVTVLFGIRAKYTPAVYYALAGIQLALICVAAWNVGAWAVRDEAQGRRMLSLAGGLLIAPWALFSFLPGIGPPGDQTAAENELRYVILLINAMAVAAGFVVLKEALIKAGEHFYSTLGFAAILVATPLYLFWATIAVGYFREKGVVAPGQVSPSFISRVELSDIPLFFGGALTYLTSVAFAASLGRAQWLGRVTTRAFVMVIFVAFLCLLIRGLWFPNPKVAFEHWYTIPGYIVGIPAVPWILPLLLGVALLRRAGRGQADTAA